MGLRSGLDRDINWIRTDLLAYAKAGAVACHHQVPLAQAGPDLDIACSLESQIHFSKLNSIFRRNHRNLSRRLVTAQINGGNWYRQNAIAVVKGEVKFGVH